MVNHKDKIVRLNPLAHRLMSALLLVAVLMLSVTSASLHAQDADSAPTPNADQIDANLPVVLNDADHPATPMTGPFTTFLPLITREAYPTAWRIGYGTSQLNLRAYQQVTDLQAGWFVNWGAYAGALYPGGLEYMPMVRVHQEVSCGESVTADRERCPYTSPPAYIVYPSFETIASFAKLQPGMTWLIGNEMDRVDWTGGQQDEMRPELYARAYKEISDVIRAADPVAKIAIGGVIQATPLRLQYLDTVWNTYRQLYGKDMQVDVWNIHNFIAPEYCQRIPYNNSGEWFCYGMAVPPGDNYRDEVDGVKDNIMRGAYTNGNENWRHTDMGTFGQQIRAIRQWMKDHGQMNKPLIITEYGVLYPSLCVGSDGLPLPPGAERNACIHGYGSNWTDLENPYVVADFMIKTFDYFLNTKDCNLSAIDGCRLVQRWAWFSIEDVGWSMNPHGALFNRQTKQMTMIGERFRDWVKQNYNALSPAVKPY